MESLIEIKYCSGSMVIDLENLFYGDDPYEPDSEIIHYSALQRITKLFKFFYQEEWNNKESFQQCIHWLDEEKKKYEAVLEIESKWMDYAKEGTSKYKKRKREVNSCKKYIKLFSTAIRILNEGR